MRHKVFPEIGEARAAVRVEARVRPRQLAVVDERDVRHEATQALPRHCHLRAVMRQRASLLCVSAKQSCWSAALVAARKPAHNMPPRVGVIIVCCFLIGVLFLEGILSIACCHAYGTSH